MAAENKSLHIPSTASALPKHWRWERLDEVCDGVFDCPHSTPILTDNGPFVVRSQDVRTGVFRMEQAGHVSEETYQERIARAEPQFGDLVYSREGTYFGNAAEVPPDVQVCLGQRMVLLRPNEQKANFRFLRFWLNSHVMARHIHGHRDGTVAERLNMPTIRALPVALPARGEQDAIADLLGSLDDKIEANRRMNETLEALAQTVFKDWFVDAAATKLPKGWREAKLGELVELRADRVEATPAKDKERYIALEDMPSQSIDLTNHQLGSAVNSSIIKFQVGDILFGSMRPYFHKVGVAFFDGITRTTTFVLRPKRENFRHFALFHFFSKEVIDFATTASVGTTIPYIKWDALKNYEISIPPDSLLDEFEEIASPLVQRIGANGAESRTLAELRDALLPKLLSGELRVSDGLNLKQKEAN